MQGKVKWYNGNKGFGFAQGDDGNDYFIHHSQVQSGDNLIENTSIEFTDVETDKGLQAKKVVVLQ